MINKYVKIFIMVCLAVGGFFAGYMLASALGYTPPVTGQYYAAMQKVSACPGSSEVGTEHYVTIKVLQTSDGVSVNINWDNSAVNFQNVPVKDGAFQMQRGNTFLKGEFKDGSIVGVLWYNFGSEKCGNVWSFIGKQVMIYPLLGSAPSAKEINVSSTDASPAKDG